MFSLTHMKGQDCPLWTWRNTIKVFCSTLLNKKTPLYTHRREQTGLSGGQMSPNPWSQFIPRELLFPSYLRCWDDRSTSCGISLQLHRLVFSWSTNSLSKQSMKTLDNSSYWISLEWHRTLAAAIKMYTIILLSMLRHLPFYTYWQETNCFINMDNVSLVQNTTDNVSTDSHLIQKVGWC